MTSSVFSATIHLAFAGVAHLVERDLAKVEVASSSLVARSKKKHHPSGWCFLFGMPRAGLNLLPRPARSALNQEVWQGSCEWLCHSWDAGSESSLVARSKKKHHPSGWCFLFGMPRAGLNSLPRPARSALNQEVRQGSCEWLCHSWDAGSESSLVARSKKKHHPSGWCFLFGMSRAGLNSLPRPARSALNQEVRQGSCEWLCHSWDAGSESRHVMRTSPSERWST